MAETSQRRSDRISLVLPLAVSGKDAVGHFFSEDTTTLMVSLYGAAIALKTALVRDQEIIIRRRTHDPREAECQVLEQIGWQSGLHIFSVAFRKPALGFWDVYFPPLPSDRNTAGRAVLGCEVCGTRKIVHLGPEELAVYNATRQLSLRCDKCGKSTTWLESQQATTMRPEMRAANPARLAVGPPSSAKNQRKHRRVMAEIPVCIRQAGSDDDLATTVDISHGGMLLTSSRRYQSGSYIQVAVPYSPTAVNVFADARVVHSAKLPSQEMYRLGIMYLAENGPPS